MDSRSPQFVIMIGPGPEQVGGMASVVSQLLAMDFDGTFRHEFLPMTLTSGDDERPWHRVRRHTRQLARLGRLIRSTDARLVHIHTCSGFSFFRSTIDMLAAQGLGCRVILHIHGAQFDVFHGSLPTWRRRLVRWSLERADRVIALSESWQRKLQTIAPTACVTVIENAVAIPPYGEAPTRPGPCRFVMLARMDEWKGVNDLLTACRHLHQSGTRFEMVLAGPPGTAGDAGVLADRIREAALEGIVHYVGTVHGREKTELLESADVYVQPSHHEGMPIALLEALAHGRPVVATSVGAVPEVITDRVHGFLVPPHKPRLLAERMGDLANDRSLRGTMSRRCRRLIEGRFAPARLRRDVTALYESLLEPNSHQPLAISH